MVSFHDFRLRIFDEDAYRIVVADGYKDQISLARNKRESSNPSQRGILNNGQ